MKKNEEDEEIPKVAKRNSKTRLDEIRTQFSESPVNQLKRKVAKPKKTKSNLNNYFQDEAQEGDSAQPSSGQSMQFTQINIKKAESQIEIKPKVSEQWIKQFDGKSEDEVNNYFQKRFIKKFEEEQSENIPGSSDPKIFCFRVKPNQELDICLSLSHKLLKQQSKCKQEEEDTRVTSNIISFMFLKKKKGFLFAQAYQLNDVKTYLKGKHNIKQDSIVKITDEDYDVLFTDHREARMNQYELGNYVRVTKGIYEGDLGRICKLRKSDMTLLLVPRINMSQLYANQHLKEEQNKNAVVLLSHHSKDSVERPPRAIITNPQHIEFLKQFKIAVTKDGLVKLMFRYCDVTADVGPLHPKEICYFNIDQDLLEFLQKQSKMINKKVEVKVGSLVQIIEGANAGKKGMISKIDSHNVVVTVKDKTTITVPITNVRLIFGKGDYVVVVSGSDMGKEGIVLMNQGPQTTILTTNDNTIKVLTSCLGRRFGSDYIPQKPAVEVKKFDMVNYGKAVGIVLISTSHTILVLNGSNNLQTISPLEVMTIIKDKDNFTVNQYKEEINNKSMVKILSGQYQGKICQVKHVHSEKAYLFHKDFLMTHNIWVEDITNLKLITTGNRLMNKGPRHKQLVGKTVIINQGIYKGYQGTIRQVIGQQVKLLISAKRMVVEINKACLAQSALYPMKTEQSIPSISRTPHYNRETRTYEIIDNQLST